MSIKYAINDIKRHCGAHPDGFLDLVEAQDVGEGLATLPGFEGWPSRSQNVVSLVPLSTEGYTNALETKDGSFLRYDYAKSRVQKCYQAKTDTFLKALKASGKERLPRIDLQAGTIQGIFADFDSLEKLSRLMPGVHGDSWANARRWLALKFNNGCVFTSASGKAKIFFPFNEFGLTTAKAKNRAKTLLGTDYYEAVDPQGVRYSFINTDSYITLSSWLKDIEYDQSIEFNNRLLKNRERGKDIVLTTLSNPKPSTYVWNSYKGAISQNMLEDLKGRSTNRHLEGVIRYALGNKTCIGSGVAIPQVLLAHSLGISQQTASRALRVAVGLGILKVTNPAIEGYRAAKYAFCGFWAVEAANIFRNVPEATGSGLKAIVDSIRDGTWNKNLFRLTNYFNSEQDYLGFVVRLPGYGDKGERAKQAVNAWRCHVLNDEKKRLFALKTA